MTSISSGSTTPAQSGSLCNLRDYARLTSLTAVPQTAGLVTKTLMPTNSTDPVFKMHRSFLHHAWKLFGGKTGQALEILITTLSSRGVYKLFDRGGASHI